MREVGLEIGQIRDVLISLQLNNRLPLRSRTSSAPAPSDSFPDAPGTVLAIRPCTLDNRNSGQRAMPNISDVPIDWANVDWLYVIVLSVIVFFSTLICTLAFRGALMSAILFAIAFIFFTYYPHSLPLPTSLKKAPAPAAPAAPPPRNLQ